MQSIYTWLKYAEIVDAYRVVPRILLVGYGVMLYHTTMWFMALDAPSAPQSTFIGVVWGAAAAITAFYNKTGRDWTKDD